VDSSTLENEDWNELGCSEGDVDLDGKIGPAVAVRAVDSDRDRVIHHEVYAHDLGHVASIPSTADLMIDPECGLIHINCPSSNGTDALSTDNEALAAMGEH
jgi:hypothetical protein